jgi:hypothetical protein
VAGAAYFVLGLAAFYSADSSRDLEFKHLTYMIEGTAVRWVLYGLFMHFFVLAWGGRKGFPRTVDAYAYTIGILQPVLAFVIFALTLIYPTDYKWEIGGGRMAGGSGGAFIIATLVFKGLAPSGVLLFHLIGSILICFCLSPAFSVAHVFACGEALEQQPPPWLFLGHLRYNTRDRRAGGHENTRQLAIFLRRRRRAAQQSRLGAAACHKPSDLDHLRNR